MSISENRLTSPSLTASNFLLASAVLMTCLALSNVVVSYLTRNSLPRRVLARASTSGNSQVLALGNSLIAAGFDENSFDDGMKLPRLTGAVNLGLGASLPVEHLLILRAALRANAQPRILVYGFYDLQLTAPVNLSTDELFGNHAMLYYVEPKFGERYFHQSLHDRVEFAIMRRIPMAAERGAIWAKIERFRRKLAEQGLGKEATNRFGNVTDFSLLEAPEIARFSSDCALASTQDFNPAVDEMIREASDRGIETVVVEMPMHPYHVETYYRSVEWKHYADSLRTRLATRGVGFIDASEWVGSEEKFADHLHLSEEGAAEFSERLGTEMRAR